MTSPLSGIAKLGNCKTMRVSSYDKTGGNADHITIPAGETVTIADISGSGIIKHIWCTISAEKDPMHLRNIILRMYWDGECEPSVCAPIGDFFGQGWGEYYNYVSLPMAAAPMGGKALNCFLPMPFAQGAKITLENDSQENVGSFYYYIDYEEHQSIGNDAGRFHAQWTREITAPYGDVENEGEIFGPTLKNLTNRHNFVFADIVGKGHFVGLHYFVESPTPIWYGEGDDMWMVDGEQWPGSLHGTGTEDFFNTSWCPREVYNHPYFGIAKVPTANNWLGRTHNYRFLLEDPVYFEKSLHASIEHGHANVLTLDIATVAFWYQLEPHKVFSPMLSRENRQNMRGIGMIDIHKWRDAWRKSKGGGALWGNE